MAAVLLAGVVIGATQLTPVGAHVTDSVAHLWQKHIRPKADVRYVQRNQTAWAVVGANGTLVRSARAQSSEKLATGNYDVIFNRDVSKCAYAATINDSTLGAEIGAEPRTTNANAVFVTTWASNGTPSDKPFHLVVTCGGTP